MRSSVLTVCILIAAFGSGSALGWSNNNKKSRDLDVKSDENFINKPSVAKYDAKNIGDVLDKTENMVKYQLNNPKKQQQQVLPEKNEATKKPDKLENIIKHNDHHTSAKNQNVVIIQKDDKEIKKDVKLENNIDDDDEIDNDDDIAYEPVSEISETRTTGFTTTTPIPQTSSTTARHISLASLNPDLTRGADTNSSLPDLRKIPQFMVELYERFSSEKYSHPMANTVRSFTQTSHSTSEHTDTPPIFTTTPHVDPSPAPHKCHDSHRRVNNNNNNHTRTLTSRKMNFYITSGHPEEDLYLAELRLYRLVRDVPDINASGSAKDVSDDVKDASGRTYRLTVLERKMRGGGECWYYEEVCVREVKGWGEGWETLTVTDTTRQWLKHGDDHHTLEVRLDVIDEDIDTDHSFDRLIDFEDKPQNDREPFLLIFSNDRRRHESVTSRDLRDVIKHVNEVIDEDADDDDDYNHDDNVDDDDDDNDQMRYKRSVDNQNYNNDNENYDNKNEKYNNHNENYNNENENYYNNNEKYNNENENYSCRKENYNDNADRFGNGIRNGAGKSSSDTRGMSSNDTRGREKRDTRRRSKRKSVCRRKKMYVDFKELNWHTWIIHPTGYEAYQCVGGCNYPVSDHLTPTKHAVIQTLLHAVRKSKADPSCCVPTRLDPISILYIDDTNTVTYKYKFEGMVVSECGCR